MTHPLIVANHVFLLLCASMYFGTGWSLLLFSFPTAPDLRPDNYRSHFIPQVKAATRLFRPMTTLMIPPAVVMLVTEWDTPMRWAPVVFIAALAGATVLTVKFIFPYNKVLEEGVTDEAELRHNLERWMELNRWRNWLWTLEWVAMVAWFAWAASRGR